MLNALKNNEGLLIQTIPQAREAIMTRAPAWT
jgi:hypothetical protein